MAKEYLLHILLHKPTLPSPTTTNRLKVVTLETLAAATSRAVAVRTLAVGWSRRPLNIEH